MYTDTGHLYIDLGNNSERYVGKPSPEVDQAWEDLLGGDLLQLSLTLFLTYSRKRLR